MIFFLILWSKAYLVKCTGWVWTNTYTCATPTLITVWSINTPEVYLILYPAYPFPSHQRQPPSSMLLLSFWRVLKPHKWAHLICILLPKASFTQHHTFQTDACWPLCQHFGPFLVSAASCGWKKPCEHPCATLCLFFWVNTSKCGWWGLGSVCAKLVFFAISSLVYLMKKPKRIFWPTQYFPDYSACRLL